MALLDIRVFGDPVLRQKAREVATFDAALRRLAADMLETMREAPGVGLAAPQVGVLKRLFTWEVPVEVDEDDATAPEGEGDVDEGDDGQRPPRVERVGGAVANPRLLEASEEIEESDEGCLSFPGLFYPVARPLEIATAWQDLDGGEHESRLRGFLARVWLHEMDHLNGILFIDHLAKHDRRAAMREMREYRQEHGLEQERPRNLLLGRRA